jgi:L-ascorbate 6-phosphate lactonase
MNYTSSNTESVIAGSLAQLINASKGGILGALSLCQQWKSGMIQPVQSGGALLEDINTTQVKSGAVAIWWLGQSGYAIKTHSILFYIDLYLSEHLTAKYADTPKPHIRMTAAPLRAEAINNAQWVFASHKHSDHLDPGTLPDLMAASPQAALVLPAALTDHAVSLGLDRTRLIPTRGDETFTIGPMTVHSIPSAHPDLDYTDETGYPFLGYVFEVDGLRMYHSGDTLVYDGLTERLCRHQPDIVFLPINGSDERRKALHVPPNMNIGDALKLAADVKAGLLIPHHYDMFTFNTVDIADFERAAASTDVPYAVLRVGEKFAWSRGAASG